MINEKYTDFKFDFERYILKIVSKRQLVEVNYYNASLKQGINAELFKRQQRFFERLRKLDKWKVVLCKRQKRGKHPDGRDEFSIKGDDIHLAVDMLADAYENRFDVAVLISGDGDFQPLVSKVRAKGKRVENIHFTDNISLDLLKHCNTSQVLDKKTVNKFFYRTQPTITLGDTDAGKKLRVMEKDK